MSNGAPLHDIPGSRDTQTPCQGHATYAVDSQENVTDSCTLNFSGSTETTVTMDNQTCYAKNSTPISQEETQEAP